MFDRHYFLGKSVEITLLVHIQIKFAHIFTFPLLQMFTILSRTLQQNEITFSHRQLTESPVSNIPDLLVSYEYIPAQVCILDVRRGGRWVKMFFFRAKKRITGWCFSIQIQASPEKSSVRYELLVCPLFHWGLYHQCWVLCKLKFLHSHSFLRFFVPCIAHLMK